MRVRVPEHETSFPDTHPASLLPIVERPGTDPAGALAFFEKVVDTAIRLHIRLTCPGGAEHERIDTALASRPLA